MASLDEQSNAYLSDAHAIEEQALPQMRAAPDRLDESFDRAVEASLAAQEVHA